jgi:hypothetical protein
MYRFDDFGYLRLCARTPCIALRRQSKTTGSCENRTRLRNGRNFQICVFGPLVGLPAMAGYTAPSPAPSWFTATSSRRHRRWTGHYHVFGEMAGGNDTAGLSCACCARSPIRSTGFRRMARGCGSCGRMTTRRTALTQPRLVVQWRPFRLDCSSKSQPRCVGPPMTSSDERRRFELHTIKFSIAQQRAQLERAEKAGADEEEVRRIRDNMKFLGQLLQGLSAKD